MDVIDELIAHCEAWEPWARVMGNVCAGDAAQALRSLRAELAALQQMYTAQGLTIKRQQDELAECKQDAERYRWLRGTVPESSSRWARWRLECWIREFDHAIDAAMAGGE